MATLDELEKRLALVERRVAVVESDIADLPRLVSTTYDLLRNEVRSFERKIESKMEAMERRLEARFDAGIRSIAELISSLDGKG